MCRLGAEARSASTSFPKWGLPWTGWWARDSRKPCDVAVAASGSASLWRWKDGTGTSASLDQPFSVAPATQAFRRMSRPRKITLGEMRASGMRGLLIYCSDFRCSHLVAISANGWPDDVRLSDIEPRFTCRACGRRGAEVRLDFDWDKPPRGHGGYWPEWSAARSIDPGGLATDISELLLLAAAAASLMVIAATWWSRLSPSRWLSCCMAWFYGGWGGRTPRWAGLPRRDDSHLIPGGGGQLSPSSNPASLEYRDGSFSTDWAGPSAGWGLLPLRFLLRARHF